MANGSVEGLVGYARRNFMVPVPRFASWEEFNACLEAQCRKRQNDILRSHNPSQRRRCLDRRHSRNNAQKISITQE